MIAKELFQKKDQNGNVLIVTMLFFVAITLSIGMGLVLPVLRSYRSAEHSIKSKQSYAASESGVEDVLYRIENNLPVGATETLVLGTETATTSVTDISSDKKEISALGDADNRQRTVQAILETGSGLSFNYGLQVGRGGLFLDGSSGIKGNVYANGNITACGSCYITGSAVAANSESETVDQQNGSGVPDYNLVFGNASVTEDIAQSFSVSTEVPLSKVQLYLKKSGTPSNLTVSVVADNGGKPGTTYLAQGTISASTVTTSYGWVNAVFSANPTLQIGTTYWLVVNASSNSSKYYTIGADSSGYSGNAKIGKYGGAWNATNPSTADLFFRLYLGGLASSIIGTGNPYYQFQVGTGGSGYAKAHTITNTSATGSMYCATGTGNNKPCDTSQGDATPQPWPVSEANIADWQSQALAGGTLTGDQYPGDGYQTASMGPKKIVGNLHVGGSATLKVTGNLWVTGDLIIDGAAIVKLDSSYGSGDGVIVVDGNVEIAGSAPVQGSGTTGSYLMVVSLSDCPTSSSCVGTNAVDVSGAAGAVVLVAQNGTIEFSGSAHAKQATGYAISLSGSTDVTYESGLADMTFDSGPSGAWNVTSWKEK